MRLRHSIGSSRDGAGAAPPRDLAHLSDEAVVALVARFDEVALVELYDRYAGTVHSLALRILSESPLAERVVEETFVAVSREARRFVPESSTAGSWLLTLAHRRAVELVRNQPNPRPDTTSRPAAAATEHSAWRRLERERVQAAVRRLPDRQREVLELIYYAGFSVSDVAMRLGRPLTAVTHETYDALANLRELLEPITGEASWKTT